LVILVRELRIDRQQQRLVIVIFPRQLDTNGKVSWFGISKIVYLHESQLTEDEIRSL
jgi:hypothetical protein